MHAVLYAVIRTDKGNGSSHSEGANIERHASGKTFVPHQQVVDERRSSLPRARVGQHSSVDRA